LFKHNGHPKAITQIAIDMSPAYTKGVRDNFGNAIISFDKLHVVSQVVQAVEESPVRLMRCSSRIDFANEPALAPAMNSNSHASTRAVTSYLLFEIRKSQDWRSQYSGRSGKLPVVILPPEQL